MQFNIADTSSITFEYAALRNGGMNTGANGRNLLIDGGELSGLFANAATTSTAITVIPEPSSSFLVLLSFGSLLFVRRR